MVVNVKTTNVKKLVLVADLVVLVMHALSRVAKVSAVSGLSRIQFAKVVKT
jgi:hypothetical protein